MVAGHYGHRVTLPELRRRFAVSLKGVTLKALMQMADTLGLATRPLRVELETLGQVRLPAILHWDMSHYVVLSRVTRRWVEVLDPAVGLRRLSSEEVSKHFNGVVLELQPAPGFRRKTVVDRVRLMDLWTSASGFGASIAQMLLLSLVLQAFAILAPMLNQMVIDDAIAKGDLGLLGVLALGLALLTVVQALTSLLRGYVAMHFGTLLSFQMTSNLLRHLLRLPVPWFEKRQMGDILSRFGSLKPVQQLFTSGIIAVALDGLMAMVTLTVMLLYAPQLTAMVLAALTVFTVVRLVSFPILRRMTDEGIQLGAKEQMTFLETIRGARAFKLFGREQERHALWQNAHADTVNNSLKVQRLGLWGGTFNTLLSGAETLLVLYLGARMVIAGELTLGMLLAFQAYRGQFTGAAIALINQWFAFRMLGLHLERLADVVHQEPETEPATEGDGAAGAQRPYRGGLALRKASFRYADHEPWVLKDVDIRIGPGEFAAFVGPSGGGKSTLLKLLTGLYPPTEGEFLVDDVPLRGFGLAGFRSRIGVVDAGRPAVRRHGGRQHRLLRSGDGYGLGGALRRHGPHP